VNGIAGSDVVFGALPAGTANVLAIEVGLPARPDLAAPFLLDAVPTRISLGALDVGTSRRYFLLMLGVGLDARIVRDLDPAMKRRVGKLAYWHAGARQLGRPLERFRVRVNGQDLESSFVLVTRVRNYGGDFEIARNIRLTDPDFEVVIFERHAWLDYLRVVGAVVTNRLYKMPGVTVCRAAEVSIEAIKDHSVYMQADGEELGRVPATITAVPNSLTLLLPKRYAEK
jgi:diacylglycerol kinase (ATP)